nr:nucleotidyltransferase family protein [Bacillus rubiinfantis]
MLAAGFSKRMGAPKLLLPYKGKPLIRHMIDECLQSQVDGTIVVVNPEIETLVAEVSMNGINKVVENYHSQDGMSTSLKIGLKSVPDDVNAVIFLLGDQPLMTANEINKIISDYHSHQDAPIIQAKYEDGKGHPILFTKNMFPHLLCIDGDEGGKSVLMKFHKQVYYSEMNRKLIPDIDTHEDYQLLINEKN